RGRPLASGSTIHRFQGSERDLIVLDLVDGPDQTRPSRLTGADLDLSRRLLNVAASRAKGKLIVLADRPFINDVHPLNSSGRVLLECALDTGAETIDAVELLATLPESLATDPLVQWFSTWDDATRRVALEMAEVSRVDLHLPSS